MSPTQEEIDAQAKKLFDLMKPHLPRLNRERVILERHGYEETGYRPNLEIIVPEAWDELKLGHVGVCFRYPVIAGDADEPIIRVKKGGRR
jgi:hypothetical protein